MGKGDISSKYLVVFYNNKNSEDNKKLKAIFDYVNIENPYYTSIIKCCNDIDLENNEKKEAYSILLAQISNPNIKYIITIGEETLDFIIKEYIKEHTDIEEYNKIVKLTPDTLIENRVVNIKEYVGNIYDFYGKYIIPLFDMGYIKKASKKEKQRIVDILSEINMI